MKLVLIFLAAFTFTAHAEASGFTSLDVADIESALRPVSSGQSRIIKLKNGEAICHVNTISNSPIYECLLLLGQIRLGLTTADVRLIKEKLVFHGSGQGLSIQLRSGTVYCKNNTFAEPPGFNCIVR